MATVAAPVAPITAGLSTTGQSSGDGGQSGLTQAVAALQAVVTAAQLVVADAGATRDQRQAARALVALLQAVLAKVAPGPGPGTGSRPDRLYRVRPGDTLLGVAQTLLGDPLRWTEIRDKSGLGFLGVDVGTVLRVPAV